MDEVGAEELPERRTAMAGGGPREATHVRGGPEAMQGDGLPGGGHGGGHGGAVERRERGQAARGGGASA
jgi:hypothetical protein